MNSYKLLPEAERDLESIWLYTAQEWGVEQAMTYVDELNASFENLNEHAKSSRLRTEFTPSVYICRCNHHLIVYLENDDYIAVVRILHEKMDIDGQLEQ